MKNHFNFYYIYIYIYIHKQIFIKKFMKLKLLTFLLSIEKNTERNRQSRLIDNRYMSISKNKSKQIKSHQIKNTV